MERCWDGGQLGRAHGQSRTEAAAGRGRDLAGASVAKLDSLLPAARPCSWSTCPPPANPLCAPRLAPL